MDVRSGQRKTGHTPSRQTHRAFPCPAVRSGAYRKEALPGFWWAVEPRGVGGPAGSRRGKPGFPLKQPPQSSDPSRPWRLATCGFRGPSSAFVWLSNAPVMLCVYCELLLFLRVAADCHGLLGTVCRCRRLPGFLQHKPAVSAIEGRHGAVVSPTPPGFPTICPSLGRVLDPPAPNAGTVTH